MKRFPALCVQREKGRQDRFYSWFPRPEGGRKKIIFGPSTDPASRAKYEEMKSEWEKERGEKTEAAQKTETIGNVPVVANLIGDFMIWARARYVRTDGTQTGRASSIWKSLKLFLIDYGTRPCDEITLDDLEAFQRRLDASGRYCRGTVNGIVYDVLSAFKWGIHHRINGARYVSPSTVGDLSFIEKLRRGACKSIDHPRRGAANISDVERTLPFLPPAIRTILRLTLLTGSRPGEIRILRPCDVREVSPDLWEYKPTRHKTERYGGERVIYFGPRAIAILNAEIVGFDGEPTDYLFRPKDAARDRYLDQQRRKRSPSKVKRDAERRARAEARRDPFYSGRALSVAVRRACESAGIKPWTPYQLRKAAATYIDKEFGAEAAAAVLGHRNTTMTENHYIDPRREKAAEIARKIG